MWINKFKYALRNCLKDPALHPLTRFPSLDLERCAEDYVENFNVAKQVCTARGWVYRNYLQPDAANRRQAPTKFDMSACAHLARRETVDGRDYGQLVTAFLKRLEEILAEEPIVASMRTYFEGHEGEIFFDHAHLSDRGYDLMAKSIAEDILREERR